ncbi:Fungal-trans domain-containing protein [Mycena venus]|uniref:Fungal-trans domain-containing protein n=1 Tax=Mycena venus TaxID=2733690 RepID=A0A8H6WUP5_9AGAR|nr:Fungal-trans domain-containing protein [Mycena venus]
MTDLPGALPVPGSKRRRLRGSCDICKQRKIRCDSSKMPGGKCSNCIAFNSECTHTTTTKPTSPKEPKASKNAASPTSTDAKKTAKDHVAAIVLQATSYIGDTDVRRVLLDVARYARSLENELAACKRSSSVPSSLSPMSSPSPPTIIKEEENESFVNGILTERFDRFRLDSDLHRYFGKSSHYELINTAIDIKRIVQDHSLSETNPPSLKRPLFWRSPWEYDILAPPEVFPVLVYPAPDLLRSLVDLFFTKVNIILLLIHRPTFEKSLASGLHFVDHAFGSTVLAVCAVAAKYSDDPRVLLDGTDSRLSSGWKYYAQLKPTYKPLMRSFTLHEAQTLCLAVFYLQGSSAPDGCWALGGAGVRYAQEAGVHRRNRYADKVLDEQWKRVFWILICIDTYASSFCGRPRATSSDDYDLDYPIECDDEYWETADPGTAFKQPPGRPSVVSYFVAYLKLIEIMGMAQKTIYLVNQRSRTDEWTQEAVASLDSALNAWIDLIPAHLKWDPHMEDPIFATQSAVLYACYYHVQIQVHRIFIVSPGRKARQCLPVSQPCPISYNTSSVAICASSARACSHVMDVASKRGFLCNPHVLNAVFDSCVVLLLNVWGGRLIGLAVDPKKCLQDVESCLQIFRIYETRWQIAGRQYDIIMELTNAAHMDMRYTPRPLKRGRDDTDASTGGISPPIPERSSSQKFASSTVSDLDIDTLFALPMYSEDLSRLPLYEPLNWDTNNWVKDLQTDFQLPDHVQNIIPPSSSSSSSDSSDSGVALPPDSMAVLTGVPGGYDWDDWGKYITSVEELMQSFEQST